MAHVHWLGKKRISAESNATNFMAIWNLPESVKLEAQTLDKLSTAPWRLLSVATPLSNAPVALFRPLLDDLAQEESYLEVQAATNQPGTIVLALHLDAVRAATWRTNLPIILTSICHETQSPEPGVAPTDFTLQTSDFSFGMSHSGDWTLLAFSPAPSALRLPDLLADFAARIQRDRTPFAPQTTNYWLETEADLAEMAITFGTNSIFNLPFSIDSNLPRINMTLIGDGQNIRTRGELNFPGPVPIEIKPWNIPTNLVHDPLIGFMGVRGIRPWLKALKLWDEAQLGNPPNQAFFWAQDGLPALRFFALPSVQASNQLHLFSEFLLNEVNPLFASSSPSNGFRYGSFEHLPDSWLLRWRGVPYIAPNLDLDPNGGNSFITGGLFRNLQTNRPAPDELLRQFQADTNLVLYDWETTQSCESSLLQITQLGRLVFGRARLSITNNAALPWLVAISPKLGNAVTSVRLADLNRLTFSRSATVGFTGMELHLLADWLESPSFPRGFFTLEAKPTPLVAAPAPQPTKAP